MGSVEQYQLGRLKREVDKLYPRRKLGPETKLRKVREELTTLQGSSVYSATTPPRTSHLKVEGHAES